MNDLPGGPARFVTETSLDYLARRLRFLGHDVETLPGARLEELLAAARASGRVALTTSERHPRAFADVPAIVVRRDDPEAAVRRLAARFAPAHPPFTRCVHCNMDLASRTAAEATGHVPEAILVPDRKLWSCPRCGRWYWHGSHVDRVRAWLERAIGRKVEGPGGAPR